MGWELGTAVFLLLQMFSSLFYYCQVALRSFNLGVGKELITVFSTGESSTHNFVTGKNDPA